MGLRIKQGLRSRQSWEGKVASPAGGCGLLNIVRRRGRDEGCLACVRVRVRVWGEVLGFSCRGAVSEQNRQGGKEEVAIFSLDGPGAAKPIDVSPFLLLDTHQHVPDAQRPPRAVSAARLSSTLLAAALAHHLPHLGPHCLQECPFAHRSSFVAESARARLRARVVDRGRLRICVASWSGIGLAERLVQGLGSLRQPQVVHKAQRWARSQGLEPKRVLVALLLLLLLLPPPQPSAAKRHTSAHSVCAAARTGRDILPACTEAQALLEEACQELYRCRWGEHCSGLGHRRSCLEGEKCRVHTRTRARSRVLGWEEGARRLLRRSVPAAPEDEDEREQGQKRSNPPRVYIAYACASHSHSPPPPPPYRPAVSFSSSYCAPPH